MIEMALSVLEYKRRVEWCSSNTRRGVVALGASPTIQHTPNAKSRAKYMALQQSIIPLKHMKFKAGRFRNTYQVKGLTGRKISSRT